MRTEAIYTTDQSYDGEIYGASLKDGSLGRLYGRGSGTVDWSGQAGVIEWSNFPQRSPEGTYHPNLTGLIRIGDMEHGILYRMHGLSIMGDDRRRHFAGSVRWYTDEPDYLWLNDRHGFEEGVIDPETLLLRTRVFALHPEDPE